MAESKLDTVVVIVIQPTFLFLKALMNMTWDIVHFVFLLISPHPVFWFLSLSVFHCPASPINYNHLVFDIYILNRFYLYVNVLTISRKVYVGS